MPMARMEPAEAVLHFRKVLTEDTTVACVGTLPGLSFNMTGKVTEASDTGVAFSAKDTRCNLTLLPFFDDVRFVFSDPNDLPGAIRNPMLPNSAAVMMCIKRMCPWLKNPQVKASHPYTHLY